MVLKRYREHMEQRGEREHEEAATVTLASENPLIVMLDEGTGNKYMRSVDSTVCYLDNCPASLEQTLPGQAFVNYVLGQYFAGLIW